VTEDDAGAPADSSRGRRLIVASWMGTASFAAASLLGVVAIDTFAPLVVGLSAAMFAVGCVLFFVAYATAVSRSRTESIGIGGLYFLAGSAPAEVRASLMASFGLQCAVVVAVVAIRPFTSLVLGALSPMYGLGCAGVWGARYGWFPPRVAKGDRR
jgi:hypothetical protein